MIYETTKANFRKQFIDSIVSEFKHEVYWNGKESLAYGLEIKSSKVLGCSYTSKDREPIVLKYFKYNHFGMIKTLIHEVSHSELHKVRDIGKFPALKVRNVKEFEVESVVSKVFSILGIEDVGSRENYYFNRIDESELDSYNLIKNDRDLLINSLSERIASILLNNIELINYIKSISISKKQRDRRELYKYEIVCPYCEEGTLQKRKVKMDIRYCGNCGEEDTLGKLILRELDEPTAYAY